MRQTLPSPPETQFNYRLGIRRQRDQMLITDRALIAKEPYGFVLRAAPGLRQSSAPRFVYLFMVDSYGRSVLIFPRGPIGSVENRFPLRNTSPAEISLGEAPFGTDTYFLLSNEDAFVQRVEVNVERDRRRRLQLPPGIRLVPAASQWSIERLSCTFVVNLNAGGTSYLFFLHRAARFATGRVNPPRGASRHTPHGRGRVFLSGCSPRPLVCPRVR